MSGIEVASLVIGVVPLLVEIAKSYSTISQGLHTFRKCSQETRLLLAQMETQKAVFTTIMRQLLRILGRDGRDVQEMLDDLEDKRWQSQKLSDNLTKALQLQPHLESCLFLMKEMITVLKVLEEELKSFDILLDQKREDEPILKTIKRLKNSVQIAFDKSKHERCLERLRGWNTDLLALLHQGGEHTQSSRTSQTHRIILARFETIRTASQKLHDVLCRSWRCSASTNPLHCAKLCIEAQADAEFQLKLAIACQASSDDTQVSTPQQTSLWLYVQTASVSSPEIKSSSMSDAGQLPSGVPTTFSAATSSNLSVHGKTDSTLSKRRSLRASAALASNSVKRISQRIKARLETKPQGSSAQAVGSEISLPSVVLTPALQAMNLRRKDNMCQYIGTQASNATDELACIGYLEDLPTDRHMFYLKPLEQLMETDTAIGSYSLPDCMRGVEESTLAHELRLRIAHKTVSAMLQFHGTPWLCDRWRLSQIHYLGSKDVLDKTTVESLHLTTQLSPNTQLQEQNAEMALRDEIQYGIRNPTIFALGLALQQIGRWELIEDQMGDQDRGDEIFAARRLAHRTSQYEELTRRCLDCDFGSGSKLEDETLMTAVYNEVLCRLEALIEIAQAH